jgi:hypothetical protein
VCGAAVGFLAAAACTYKSLSTKEPSKQTRKDPVRMAGYYCGCVIASSLRFCVNGVVGTGLGFMLGYSTVATLPVTIPCVVMHAMSIPSREPDGVRTVNGPK